MDKNVKIGVIGTGFGEKVHVPAFRLCRDCEVVGIASSPAEAAKEASLRLNIPRHYKDWKELIADPAIDAVSIATPPEIQSEIALRALSADKAVFCEKPLALNLREARKIASLAAKKRLASMIDLEFPEIEEWQKAREALKAGRIGKLRRISVNWHVETYANKKSLDNWKTSFEKGGGTLYNFVSHAFYYLEWLVGPVNGLFAKLSKGPFDKRSADTSDFLALSFRDGTPGSIAISTDSFPGSGHRVELCGDNGTIVLENNSGDFARGFRLLIGTRSSGKFELISSNENVQSPEDGRILPVSRITERFIKWILTAEPQEPDLMDGCRVQELIEASKKSSDSGRWISIK